LFFLYGFKKKISPLIAAIVFRYSRCENLNEFERLKRFKLTHIKNRIKLSFSLELLILIEIYSQALSL